MLALINSEVHIGWAWRYSATLKADLQYTPSDCFETFPQPEPLTERMARAGDELDTYRRSVMLGRQLGLTKLYNLVHDPEVTDPEIARLRDIHVEIDKAVAEAYGWDDLPLGHGFHPTPQGTRFTISLEAQVEALDRLLELNHERYAEEERHGLHSRRSARSRSAPSAPTLQIPTQSEPINVDDALFPPTGCAVLIKRSVDTARFSPKPSDVSCPSVGIWQGG